MAQNQNQGYQPIDENKVNWDKIEEKFGISKEVLERTGAKDNMLNFGKSGLLDVTMLIYGQKVKAAARLQLTRLDDGTYSVLPHFVRKEQKLENAEYMGYTFSKEDAKALKETGNLGKVVPLFNMKDGKTEPCFVSLDHQTNELVHYPLSRLNLRESVGNVKFTPEEMELLKQGGMVKDKQFENDKGQKFTVDFQVSADRKNVAFVPGSSRQEVAQEQEQKAAIKREQSDARINSAEREQARPEVNNEKKAKFNWTNEDGSIKNLTKWKGIPLTEEQQKDYREGKSVKLDNYPLKDGTTATMYLMFYPDKGQPFASKNDPMQGKVVAPANESETQVAVNHQGKTNEATKKVDEPLQKGQVAPKNEKQQNEQKPEGEKKGQTEEKKQKRGPKL